MSKPSSHDLSRVAALAASLSGACAFAMQPAPTKPTLAPASTPNPAPSLATKPTPATPPEFADRLRAARLQTFLARTNFSPGLIDGKPGRKTRIAIEHFQRARGLEPTGQLDEPTRSALLPGDQAPSRQDLADWTRSHTITEADLAQISGPIPEDWNERAQLAFSGYIDLPDLLAERGWCSLDLLAALNPGKELADLTVGDEVTLPDASPKPLPKLARVEINLTEKLVLGFAEGEANAEIPIFMTHCSIARDVEKRPVGELKVAVVASDPDYTFNPSSWPEVTNVSSKLRIAPGPRNPVGVAWIGLDRPGYGMHGTVRPQDIGKTGSHGCFRLTNWDAARLIRAVRVGMPVIITE